MKIAKNDTRELYSLLSDDEKKIIYALAIKKAIKKTLSMQDILLMFVALKLEKIKDKKKLSNEIISSLKRFTEILNATKKEED